MFHNIVHFQVIVQHQFADAATSSSSELQVTVGLTVTMTAAAQARRRAPSQAAAAGPRSWRQGPAAGPPGRAGPASGFRDRFRRRSARKEMRGSGGAAERRARRGGVS